MISKLINLGLRLGGVGAKFVLVMWLSKSLPVDVYGEFSLIATTITLLIYVFGFDFYNFLIREIIIHPNNRLNKILNGFMLYGSGYLLAFLLTIILATFSRLDSQLLMLTFGIGVTEHMSQELYRLLIALKRVTLANGLLFFRVFGYTTVIFVTFLLLGDIELDYVLRIWFGFNLISVLASFYIFFKNQMISFSLDKKWLTLGIKTSMFFFVGTIFLKIFEYANRYIIAIFLTNEEVGIFSFFSSVSVMITVYVNTIVVSYKLPELIEKVKEQNINRELQTVKRDLLIQSCLGFALSVVVVLIFLKWQDKTEYIQNVYLILLLGLSAVISNTSLVFYFKLYISRNERKIMISTLKSGIAAILLSFPAIYFWGMLGGALAAVISAMALFYFRWSESKQINL